MKDIFLLTLVVVGCLCAGQAICPAEGLPVSCVIDYRNPVAPELLKEAGIERVYVSVGIPIRSVEGKRVLDPKIKPQLDEFFKLYGKHGIKVLVASHYYTKPPKGTASSMLQLEADLCAAARASESQPTRTFFVSRSVPRGLTVKQK